MIAFLRAQYQHDCPTYADPTATMVEFGCGGWVGTELEGAVRPFIFHCIAGITNLGILYDGKLASCSNISRDFVQGDLRAEGIRDVWENRYQPFRDMNGRNVEPLASSSCGGCTEWAFCHGGPFHKRTIAGGIRTCLYESLFSQADRVSRIPIVGRFSIVEREGPSSA
jgi:radical SAM protein with 4Fe4S-binding SPASM domain